MSEQGRKIHAKNRSLIYNTLTQMPKGQSQRVHAKVLKDEEPPLLMELETEGKLKSVYIYN